MASLFRELLGDTLDQCPAPVRNLHAGAVSQCFAGHARISAARHPLSRLAARCAGLPSHDDEGPLTVDIQRDATGETWIRHFPQRPMRSRLSTRNGLLHERLGPASLRFHLQAHAEGIDWELLSLRVFGLPMPAFIRRGIKARERAHEGRYVFEVEASAPLIGRLVAYEGWLHVD